MNSSVLLQECIHRRSDTLHESNIIYADAPPPAAAAFFFLRRLFFFKELLAMVARSAGTVKSSFSVNDASDADTKRT